MIDYLAAPISAPRGEGVVVPPAHIIVIGKWGHGVALASAIGVLIPSSMASGVIDPRRHLVISVARNTHDSDSWATGSQEPSEVCFIENAYKASAAFTCGGGGCGHSDTA